MWRQFLKDAGVTLGKIGDEEIHMISFFILHGTAVDNHGMTMHKAPGGFSGGDLKFELNFFQRLEMPCGRHRDKGTMDFKMGGVKMSFIRAKMNQDGIKNTGRIFFCSFHEIFFK